jgi:hypothetical protein
MKNCSSKELFSIYKKRRGGGGEEKERERKRPRKNKTTEKLRKLVDK